MTADVFDNDANGNIITFPLTGWATYPIAEMAVLCQFQFVRSAEELAAHQIQRVQLVLTAQQALELADVLTKQAQRIVTENDSLPRV